MTLTRFAFLGAIAHQITTTLVDGKIFEDARDRLGSLHPKASQVVRCRLCVGSWVGLALAALYRPNLLADMEGTRPGPARRIANLAGDAVLIAIGSEVWNEALAWWRREVQVKQQAAEALDQVDVGDEESPMYPGISIRPQRFGVSR